MVPARSRGDPDLGDTYYQYWLAALERLAAEKGLVRSGELGARKAAWKRAFLDTPPRPADLVGGGRGGRLRRAAQIQNEARPATRPALLPPAEAN